MFWRRVVDSGHVNTTLCALSSVARLSVSMTMLMSSGVYRSSSFQHRSRAIGLRRPASMIAPPRSGAGGGRAALKRRPRSVVGGEIIRGPARIESMPNMRSSGNGIVDAVRRRRSARRADRFATESAAWSRCVAVVTDPRNLRSKSGAPLRQHSAAAKGGADARDNHAAATPPTATTSGGSSVVVDIEAIPTPLSNAAATAAIDRTASVPPLLPRTGTPPTGGEESDDVACLQSPVNSSGVRIVIDSDNDADPDDAAQLGHLSDGPETAATSGSASVTSGSGDDDSSNVVVLFQCGPGDDADDDGGGVVESTSGYRSAVISGVVEPPMCDVGSDASSGLHLLSDNLI